MLGRQSTQRHTIPSALVQVVFSVHVPLVSAGQSPLS
jgi:hypothetical protein